MLDELANMSKAASIKMRETGYAVKPVMHSNRLIKTKLLRQTAYK